MTVNELKTHIHYSGWASRRLLDAAVKLDQEQLSRDMKVSHGSVLGTLGHIYFADLIWYSRVVDPAIPVRSPSDSVSPDKLETEWTALQKRWEQWSNSLTDAGLTRVVSYKNLKGEPGQRLVWQLVLHVVNHATLHRGQVVAMLRQLGVQPPGTDLLFYYREQD